MGCIGVYFVEVEDILLGNVFNDIIIVNYVIVDECFVFVFVDCEDCW